LLALPVIDLPTIAEKLEVTQRTAGLLVDKLADQALLAEITGQKRGRRFAYAPLMQLLQPGWGEDEDSESA
jgi:predicted transcriptional regulator